MSEEMRGPKPMRERHKRPDKQLYVPRAVRGHSTNNPIAQDKCENDSCKNSSSNTNVTQVLDKTKNNKSKIGNSNDDVKISEITAKTTSVSISNDGPENVKENAIIHSSDSLITSKDTMSSDSDTSSGKNAVSFDKKEQDLPFRKPDDSSQITKSSGTDEISSNPDLVLLEKYDESPKVNDGDSWESMFDDDGECLNPKVIKQLDAVVARVDVKISEKNSSEYQSLSGNSSAENECIVELHDFPKEFSTQDLVSALSFFPQSSYTLKWVDDCHALALFSSPFLANQALQLSHTFVKIRPLAQGIKESQAKARYLSTVEPMKPRPTTSAVLARRLVSGALGLKIQATREQRESERTLLKEAKEKRKLLAKQRQDIWDGQV